MIISKPVTTTLNLHEANEEEITKFLNDNAQHFDSVKYLGSFIDDLIIVRDTAVKVQNNFLLIDRKLYQAESPGEQYKTLEVTGLDIFDFEYNLPDVIPTTTVKGTSHVLQSTVKSHACSPSSICERCKGSGRCKNCFSKGYLRCSSCNGNGQKKGPNGHIQKCWSCLGDGKVRCSTCSATGGCTSCFSQGRITCDKCGGTGRYQTFKAFDNIYRGVSDLSAYSAYPELSDVIKRSVNKIVFNDDIIEWKNQNTIVFDNTNAVISINSRAEDFVKELDKLARLTPESKIGRVHTYVEIVPLTILSFSFEGQQFKINIVGENNIVCYKSLPKKHSYKVSWLTRLINYFTRKKRKIAFMHIASYVFNADNVVAEDESQFFNEVLETIKLSDVKKAELRANLKEKKSLTTIAPNIKRVKKDKRAIVFAWHCAIKDNTVGEEEITALNELMTHFNIKEEEKEVLKNKARKFSGLTKEQMLEEYFR